MISGDLFDEIQEIFNIPNNSADIIKVQTQAGNSIMLAQHVFFFSFQITLKNQVLVVDMTGGKNVSTKYFGSKFE